MEDREIVGWFRERREEAISATQQKYGAYLTRVACRLLGGREEAEECVNDAYLDAWNSIPPQTPERLGAYAARLVRRRCVDRLRRRGASCRGGGEAEVSIDELAECLSAENNVEKTLDDRELSRLLTSFLETLPAESRRLFICRYWYSMPLRETAELFGMRECTAANRLFRLRAALKAYLAADGRSV